MKAKSKGRYQGLLNDLKELTIERDATYVATDGADNSITNAQMAQAVSDNKAAAFYQVGNTYMCIDSGTYTQNHIYKFTGAGWEDVTPIPTNVETTDNKVSTIAAADKTSTTKYPSVKAAVDYADGLDANAVHKSGTETIGGIKTFSSGIKVAGASGIDTSSAADLVIKRNGTSQLKVTSTGLAPTSNNAKDLGTSSYYFKDLYIKGNLKDGTNTISLADIPNDNELVHTTGDETVSGVKTFSNGISLGGSGSSENKIVVVGGSINIGSTGGNTIDHYGRFEPKYDNAYSLGWSNRRYTTLYTRNISDGTNSIAVADITDGTFNVINASDIVDNTLTQAQYDLMTNGKPTLIKGSFRGYTDAIYKKPVNYGTVDVGVFEASNEIGGYIIQSNKLLEIRPAATTAINLRSIGQINGKSVPAYQSDTTKQYKLVQNTSGTLAWVEDQESGGSVSIDNISITENDDDEIQTVGVIDQNTGNANKEWTGDKSDFNDIAVKDNNTIYLVPDELYDIGTQQATLSDGKIYPKITIAQAKEIKNMYLTLETVRIKWELTGIEFVFEPFNFGGVNDSFMVNVHGKNIKFEWTSAGQDSDLLTPIIVNGGKYEHSINVVNGTTPYGVWNYSFDFLNDESEQYTSLADVGTALYNTYGTSKRKASGTYIDTNSDTYLVISVHGTANNMVEIEYVKLSDGIVSTTTSGLLTVTDVVI